MTIFKLTVHERAGKIVRYFRFLSDAEQTFDTTYQKVAVADKPRYDTELIYVDEEPTHL